MVGPPGTPSKIAPLKLLKLIQCSCAFEQPCSTLRYTCTSSQIGCSVFGKCGGEGNCLNPRTVTPDKADDEIQDEDDND